MRTFKSGDRFKLKLKWSAIIIIIIIIINTHNIDL